MKKITFIHMPGCPYCRTASLMLQELQASNPQYAKVEVEMVDDSEAFAFAGQYYYVPTMFVDGKKLYEARPGESPEECRQHVADVLNAAVGD